MARVRKRLTVAVQLVRADGGEDLDLDHRVELAVGVHQKVDTVLERCLRFSADAHRSCQRAAPESPAGAVWVGFHEHGEEVAPAALTIDRHDVAYRQFHNSTPMLLLVVSPVSADRRTCFTGEFA